jgi:superfamily II DNA or RNA helicase
MIMLRSYQEKAIADIRTLFQQGARRVCYAAPTASGKTIVFCHPAHKIMEAGQRVAVIVHRQELVDQTCKALAAEGLEYGVVAAGYPETANAPVLVCMAQTLVNRSDRLDRSRYVIVDEAHHVTAATWRSILERVPHARMLGVTATPERLDGKGLREAFDALTTGPTVKQLIAEGWLAPFVVYAPDLVDLKGARTVAGDYALGDLARRMSAEVVLADAVAEYRKHLDGGTAIAFATTVEHSRLMARTFRAHGIAAQHLDGDTASAERRMLIDMLATGKIKVLCNCALISESLDVLNVSGVILLRPTKSLALHLQQIGRALRPSPGKRRAVILDHTGNVFRHGMPDLEHQWSLDGRPKKRGNALVRRCPGCDGLIPIAVHECPECGADLRPEPIKPAATPDPLIKLDPEQTFEGWLANGSFKDVMRWAGSDETRLHQVARAGGYGAGWVWWRLKAEREAADAAILNAAFGE